MNKYLCYLCAIHAHRHGEFVTYESETSDRCGAHPDHNLWKVKVSYERGELIQRLMSNFEYSRNKRYSADYTTSIESNIITR